MSPKLFATLLLLSFFISGITSQITVPLVKKIHKNHPEFANRATGTGTLPLSGSAEKLGEYYMQFTIGTPPQTFTAQVDTGSSDIAIPAVGCSDCGRHPDPYFNQFTSSSFFNVSCSVSTLECPSCINGNCAYTLTYLDGSGFNATLGNDTLTVAGFSFSQYFGLITEENNPSGSEFEPFPIDGIAGFAYSSVSEVNAPTLIDSMVAAGEIADIFSMCLTPSGGAITIGGTGNYHTGSLVYTPIIEESYYVVNMTDISVYGSSIGVDPTIYNRGDAIVDSGTTLLYLPYRAYKALADAFINNCKTNHLKGVCSDGNIFLGDCVSLSEADISQYPPIVFSFEGGISLPLPPQYYLVRGYCTDVSDYALAIGPEPVYDGTILGDTFMQAYECVFDRANSRMGFAPVANCPTP